jgi:hypothetical protein
MIEKMHGMHRLIQMCVQKQYEEKGEEERHNGI